MKGEHVEVELGEKQSSNPILGRRMMFREIGTIPSWPEFQEIVLHEDQEKVRREVCKIL